MTTESERLDLKADLEALTAKLEEVRDKLFDEGRKRDVRIAASEKAAVDSRTLSKRALLAGAIGMLVAVIGIVAGGVGIKANRDANSSTHAARVGSCEQYNLHEKDQARIEIGESHDQISLFVAAAQGTDPAKVAAFVEDYNRKHDRKIRAVHADALRDCSPAGIAKFLEGVTNTKAKP